MKRILLISIILSMFCYGQYGISVTQKEEREIYSKIVNDKRCRMILEHGRKSHLMVESWNYAYFVIYYEKLVSDSVFVVTIDDNKTHLKEINEKWQIIEHWQYLPSEMYLAIKKYKALDERLGEK